MILARRFRPSIEKQSKFRRPPEKPAGLRLLTICGHIRGLDSREEPMHGSVCQFSPKIFWYNLNRRKIKRSKDNRSDEPD